MEWKSKQHPAETLAAWGAPVLLAGAGGWASWTLSRSPLEIAAAVAAALALGVAVMRLLGGTGSSLTLFGFEPAAFVEIEVGELLLDDPLVEVAPDSRVVRLFAQPEPTPGELVLRIADYLNDGRRDPAPETQMAEHRPVDASAALHAALANIRASLR